SAPAGRRSASRWCTRAHSRSRTVVSGLMKLGLHVGYWGAGPPTGAQESILEAERLGFDSVWTAEAYGSDGISPLAWWGPRASRTKLGSNLSQPSARRPAAT